jgi:predicted transcriptional regulator
MSTKMSVRAHRQSRAWSISRLAQESGVSTPTIERIEAVEVGTKQNYDPRLSQVVKLADAFGVCVDALIHERAHDSNLHRVSAETPDGTVA